MIESIEYPRVVRRAIVACVGSAALFAGLELAHVVWAIAIRDAPNAEARAGADSEGQQIPEVAGVKFTASKTLAIVIRSNCKFCTDSMPFYRRLQAALEKAPSDAGLVALCVEPVEACRRYLYEHSLDIDAASIVGIDFRVGGTPTLFIVDRQRKVLASWMGRQNAAGEAEIESFLLD